MFRRRLLLSAACAVTLLATACSGQPIPTEFSLPLSQLQTAMQPQFPKHFPVAGLLQLEMQQPQLQLLPERNQLQSQIRVQLSGPALPASYQGSMEVRFGLRYESRDRTVRAHRVEVLGLQLQDANPAVADMLNTYGQRLGEQALEEFVLYQVQDQDLAVADSLQLEPGAITVTKTGLTVQIVNKAAKPN